MVYIAGPTTGKKDYRRSFDAAEILLEEKGYKVLNPARLISPTLPWTGCMRAAINLLLRCDTICLLPGWEHSRGACIEAGLADTLEYGVIKIDKEVKPCV